MNISLIGDSNTTACPVWTQALSIICIDQNCCVFPFSLDDRFIGLLLILKTFILRYIALHYNTQFQIRPVLISLRSDAVPTTVIRPCNRNKACPIVQLGLRSLILFGIEYSLLHNWKGLLTKSPFFKSMSVYCLFTVSDLFAT